MGKLEWERLIYVAGSKPQSGHSLLPFLPSVPGDNTQSGSVEVQERPSGRCFSPAKGISNCRFIVISRRRGFDTVALLVRPGPA